MFSLLSKCVDYGSRRSKICPDKPLEPIIDDVGRRIGTNPSKQSFGKSILVHSKAKEDKCDSSCSYFSSYLYHQPLPESQKSRKIRPDRDLLEP